MMEAILRTMIILFPQYVKHQDSISLLSSRPSCQRQILSRFHVESDASDDNDGTLCVLTNQLRYLQRLCFGRTVASAGAGYAILVPLERTQ